MKRCEIQNMNWLRKGETGGSQFFQWFLLASALKEEKGTRVLMLRRLSLLCHLWLWVKEEKKKICMCVCIKYHCTPNNYTLSFRCCISSSLQDCNLQYCIMPEFTSHMAPNLEHMPTLNPTVIQTHATMISKIKSLNADSLKLFHFSGIFSLFLFICFS